MKNYFDTESTNPIPVPIPAELLSIIAKSTAATLAPNCSGVLYPALREDSFDVQYIKEFLVHLLPQIATLEHGEQMMANMFEQAIRVWTEYKGWYEPIRCKFLSVIPHATEPDINFMSYTMLIAHSPVFAFTAFVIANLGASFSRDEVTIKVLDYIRNDISATSHDVYAALDTMMSLGCVQCNEEDLYTINYQEAPSEGLKSALDAISGYFDSWMLAEAMLKPYLPVK